MQITAHCHCGQVRLEAHIDPQKVFVCFCTDCQKLSGTAFRTVVPALEGSVQVTGKVQHYVKVAESGNRREQGFCPECGSPMYSRTPSEQPSYVLRVGVFDQASSLQPSVKLWQASQWHWTENLTHLPGCQRQELF